MSRPVEARGSGLIEWVSNYTVVDDARALAERVAGERQ